MGDFPGWLAWRKTSGHENFVPVTTDLKVSAIGTSGVFRYCTFADVNCVASWRCHNTSIRWQYTYSSQSVLVWHARLLCRRERVSPWAGLQLSASVPRQLAADGERRAGVRERRRRSAAVAGDVRTDDVQGAAPATDRVHRRLRLQQRLVNTTYRPRHGNVPGWLDFAHAQRAAWYLTQGHTLFCQITPF